MTFRQKLFQLLYPLVMKFNKAGNKGRILHNTDTRTPPRPVYPLALRTTSGEEITLERYRGKKLLLVNTASNCGFTSQYEELQRLYEKRPDKLAIIGFPSNEFKEQEKAGDEEIARFCKLNFGVTFPLASKTRVLKGEDQNDIYRWLTRPDQNGWNSQEPDWNFSKYLIDEEGVLTRYFGPSISPLGPEISEALDS